MISNSTDAPVVMLWDGFRTNKGGIGGYVFSYYNVGKEVGTAAREILNGTPAQDVSINQDSFYLYVYDWQELKKWGLTNSKAVPGDSLFYYYDRSFLAENKWYALGLILFLISETMLIMYLYRLNRRQREITERNFETEKMYRELMREDRFSKMTELTASLSHELNQPLTAILFSAQAGKRFLQSGKLNKEQAGQILDNIIEDDKRAGGIISSVRSLMKIELREKEKTDINSLIRETVELVRNDAIRQNVKIVLTLEADSIAVLADKIQLQQVMLNFIRNSEIAMENNDPANKKLEILTSIYKVYVTVTVRDSGPGIDSNIIDNVFKPFVTNRKGGTGIGLALSRSIIEAHNGSIWAENITGGGAVFSFRLPVLKNE
jgi:signal transduction histidine kinase